MTDEWPWDEETGRRAWQAVELEKLLHPDECEHDMANRILMENRGTALQSLSWLSEHAMNVDVRVGAAEVLRNAGIDSRSRREAP